MEIGDSNSNSVLSSNIVMIKFNVVALMVGDTAKAVVKSNVQIIVNIAILLKLRHRIFPA